MLRFVLLLFVFMFLSCSQSKEVSPKGVENEEKVIGEEPNTVVTEEDYQKFIQTSPITFIINVNNRFGEFYAATINLNRIGIDSIVYDSAGYWVGILKRSDIDTGIKISFVRVWIGAEVFDESSSRKVSKIEFSVSKDDLKEMMIESNNTKTIIVKSPPYLIWGVIGKQFPFYTSKNEELITMVNENITLKSSQECELIDVIVAGTKAKLLLSIEGEQYYTIDHDLIIDT